jgi:hypothetical protein
MKIYDALSPTRAEKNMLPMGILTFRQLLVFNKRLANLITMKSYLKYSFSLN